MGDRHLTWQDVWPALFWIVGLSIWLLISEYLRGLTWWWQRGAEAFLIVIWVTASLYLRQLTSKPREQRLPVWTLLVLVSLVTLCIMLLVNVRHLV